MKYRVPPKKEELEDLYLNKKLTAIKIGKLYKCSNTTIGKYLKRYNIPIRDTRFKEGFNTWVLLTKKQKEKRVKEASIRMTKYNPLFNEDAKKRKSYEEKRRRGSTGRLTNREKRIFIAKNPTCKDCGNTDVRVLTPHHINENTYNNNRKNLVVLCYNCHGIRHWGNSENRKRLLKEIKKNNANKNKKK